MKIFSGRDWRKGISSLGYLRYLGYLGIGIGIGLVVIPGGKTPPSPRPAQLTSIQVDSPPITPPEEPVENLLLSAQLLLTQAIVLSKENQPDQQMHQRNEKIVQLINEAINIVNQAIVRQPTDPRPWAQRAKIYQTIKQYLPEGEKVAIADWQRAIKLDPNNADYCDNLAKIYLERGELKSALFYLQKAVEADPTNPNRLKRLAEEQVRAGWLTEAKNNYHRLLPLLTDEKQKAMIRAEIEKLARLIAQAAAENQLRPPSRPEPPPEITLPDSPPLLEARDLAGGPIIAVPEEAEPAQVDTQAETNALSGVARLPAGETEVKICHNQLSPTTQVYLVPEDDPENQVLLVKKKVPYNPETNDCSHFIVAIQKPLTKDLPFRWWLVKE